MMDTKIVFDKSLNDIEMYFRDENGCLTCISGNDEDAHFFSKRFNISLEESEFLHSIVYEGIQYINLADLTGKNYPCDGAKILECIKGHLSEFGISEQCENIYEKAYSNLVKKHSLNKIDKDYDCTPLNLLVQQMRYRKMVGKMIRHR